ncbi:MAG: elongation factor G [Victivallaceae bacterium]|nr:elongation factor G [Victivallaceae bacterium]
MGNAANVRNFIIAGHAGSGKTTLSELILKKGGAIQRMGSVESKNTVSDFMPEEQERQAGIYASTLHCEWKGTQLFFSDTPGYGEFFGQVLSSLRITDAAVVLVDAVDGPQVGTARAWKLAKKRRVARYGVVSRLDRERADFKATLEIMRHNHGRNVIIPLYWPVGKEQGFERVVSVFEKDVPADIADDVAECRQLWLDAIAETDEELMNRYFENGTLTPEEIRKGLHGLALAGSTIPVFPVSAAKDIGVDEMLDAIRDIFPIPLEYVPLEGGPDKVSEEGDAFGIVFKMINDPYSGQLTFIRTVSGIFKSESDIYNISTGAKERLGQILLVNGKTTTPVAEACPGTVFAIAKLKGPHIGDTFSSSPGVPALPRIDFPTPVMSYAISAVKSGEDEKIITGLNKIAETDPTVSVTRNHETHQTLLSGMGDQHLAIVAKRLKEQFKVEMNMDTPKVPYRETITSNGEGHYRHKKQTGGAGQFAEVYLRVAYNEPGYEFANEVVGGAIPKNFIPAVEKGVLEVMSAGPLVGCIVENVRVAVYDGKYHPVDSNEMAFKIAGRRALREAISQARPVLLEPVMKVTIHIPDSYMGDISGDLNHKRGRILGMSVEDGLQVIEAEVPMAEMAKYATELRSITQGRGSFEMEFARYERVPSNVADAIIAAHQSEAEEDND